MKMMWCLLDEVLSIIKCELGVVSKTPGTDETVMRKQKDASWK